MCGIYFSNRYSDRDFVKAKMELVKYRGPDNITISSYDQFVAGHARLSIQDLSSISNQPFEDQEFTLVYNGEIYNSEYLKSAYLEGVKMETSGDTEILFRLLCKYGSDCLPWLEGMFAFVFIDKANESVMIARDRFGQKPLSYYIDNEGIEVASLVSQISLNNTLNLDIDSCRDVVFSKRIRGGKSIFKEVKKVFPGSYVRLDLNDTSTFEEIEWFNLIGEARTYHSSEKIEDLIESAVQKRLISDVPIGTFLSGGVDSSLVTALAKGVKANIAAYGVGFNEGEIDETKYILEAANKLKVPVKTKRHTRETLKIERVKEIYSDTCDEPFADDSILAMLQLSEFATRDLSVVLTGDAADECFLGYDRYERARKRWKLIRLVPLRRIVSKFIVRLSASKRACAIGELLQSENLLDLYHRSSSILAARYYLLDRCEYSVPNPVGLESAEILGSMTPLGYDL